MNPSPISYRYPVGGGHIAATIRVVFGPEMGHQRQMSAGMPIPPEGVTDEVKAKLRKMLADGLSQNILKDEWSY